MHSSKRASNNRANRSVIRETSQGANFAVESTPSLLSASEDRPFWACAKDGLVRGGRGDTVGTDTFISWQDDSDIYDPTLVSVSTGWGSSGEWTVCIPGAGGAGSLAAAYYNFNGDANDASGTNHGTISGAVFVADRFGNDNSALKFDGNDYVTIVSPFPSTDTEFTLALWLSTEVTNDGTWHAFIGYQNGGVCPGRSPSMWVARFEGLHWDSCQSGTRYAGVLQNYFPVAEVNVYQHVVWTKRGSNYYFYKAGDLYSPGGTQPAATNVQLSDNYWVGHVDNYFIGPQHPPLF